MPSCPGILQAERVESIRTLLGAVHPIVDEHGKRRWPIENFENFLLGNLLGVMFLFF